MSKPHKHATLIKAWADGETIEWYHNNEWKPIDRHPPWYDHAQYRIKPTPKWYDNIPKTGVLCWVTDTHDEDPYITIITKHSGVYFIDHRGISWWHATPIKIGELPYLHEEPT